MAASMAVVVFSLLNIAVGMSARSETRTLLNRDIVSDGRQLKLYGIALLATILSTELDVLNRLLGTTSLTGGQWLVCLGFGVALIAVEEVTKAILRRRAAGEER